MKWIFALLLFVSGTAIGQIGLRDDSTKYIRYQYQYGSRMPRFWADSALHMPYYDTAIVKPQKAGAIMMHLDKGVYKWNGGGWEVLGSAASASLSNVGSGYRLVKTADGQVKTVFVGYGLNADSTTNTDALTFSADTSSANHLVTQSDLNDIDYLSKPVPFSSGSLFLGNSITRGYSAGGDIKTYPAYLKDHLNLDTVYNLAVDGIGARRAYKILAEALTINYNIATSAMAGFNNVRGTTDTAHVFELVRSGHRAMAALLFIKRDQIQFYTMGNAGAANPNITTSEACGSCSATSEDSLAEYGSRTTWHRDNDAANSSANWWKKPSITANETVTIANVGGAGIAIGTWAATALWSRIEVRVDGVLKTTYDPNGKIGLYWADGFINDGICNDAIIITGLRDTLHVVELKFLDGGAMGGWDYIAPLKSPQACLPTPFYVWDLPHMNATGYAYPGGEVTEDQLDSCSSSRWQNLLYYFPGYPIARVPTNLYYDPTDALQIQSDGIHPLSLGHWNIARAGIDVMGPKWLMNTGAGSGTLDEVLAAGNTSTRSIILTGGGTTSPQARFGSIESQSYAVNNAWLADNIHFDGTNFKYRANGLGAQLYFNQGYFELKNATSGSAGANATMNLRMSLSPTGNAAIGGTITNSVTGAGASLIANANGNVTVPNVMQITPVGSLGAFTPLMAYLGGSASPVIAWYNSTGGTDEKISDIIAGASTLQFRLANDAYNATSDWMTVTRTGHTAATVAFPLGNVSVTGDVTVTDDAYDATGWNGNTEVPTKNAIRDKIESLGSSGIDDVLAVAQDLTATRTIDVDGNDLNIVTGATNILGLGPSDVFSYQALTADNGLYITKTGLPTSTDHSFRLVLDTSSTQVKKIVEPKTYTVLMSNAGATDPTATVLGTNTIGSIVWTRGSAGTYTGTLSSAFTANKTWAIAQRGDMAGNFVNGWISSGTTSTLILVVHDNVGNPTDNFTNMSIEVRVYP